jgi:hypothetical protein
VAGGALTIEERLARLDVTVGRRSGDGGPSALGEESRGDGQHRDEGDGDG